MLQSIIECSACEFQYVDVPVESYDKILLLFRDKIEYDPETHIEYYYLGGFNYHVKDNLEDAILFLTMAEELGSKDAAWELGRIYRYVKTDMEKAELHYKRAIELGDEDVIIPFARFLKDVKGDYKEAEVYFEKLIHEKHRPSLSDFYVCVGDYDKAEGCYQSCLDTTMYCGLASACLRYSRVNEGEIYYKKALELDNKAINPTKGLAKLYHIHKKDYDQAEIYYKRALEINKKDIETIKRLANLYRKCKIDYDQAEIYYKKALELDDTDSYFLAEIASFYRKCKINVDTAELYLTKAANSGDAHHLAELGYFYSKAKQDYHRSIFYYKKAVAKGSSLAMNNLAFIYEHTIKDYEQAETFYKKAIEHKNTHATQNLALFYMKTVGDYHQAEFYFNKDIADGNMRCVPLLIELYYLMQKPEEAFITANKYNTEDMFSALNKLTYPLSEKNKMIIYPILEKYKFPPKMSVSTDICSIMQDLGFYRQELLCRLSYHFKHKSTPQTNESNNLCHI